MITFQEYLKRIKGGILVVDYKFLFISHGVRRFYRIEICVNLRNLRAKLFY